MKRKPVRIVAFGAIVVGLVGGITLYNVTRDDVKIYVDGTLTTVKTHSRDVSSILQSAGIAVDSDDLVAPAVTDKLTETETITVQHARDLRLNVDGENITKVTTAQTLGAAITALKLRSEPATFSLPDDTVIPLAGLDVNVSATKTVSVAVDGKVQKVTTDAPSVAKVLAAGNIKVSASDIVSVPLDAGLLPNQMVSIIRMNQVQATSTDTVGFATIQESDTTKYVDETAVVTKGKPGVLTTTYTSVVVNGATISRAVLSQNVTTTPVQEIVRKGTRIKPTVLAPGQVVTAGPTVAPLPDATLGTTTPGGTVSAPSSTSFLQDPAQIKAFTKQLMASQYSWGDAEFACLEKLWIKESDWRWNADNPSSDAYGIPQSLPGSKMASAGADWLTNGATQVRWGLGYIKERYKVPCNAWGHSQRVNWY